MAEHGIFFQKLLPTISHLYNKPNPKNGNQRFSNLKSIYKYIDDKRVEREKIIIFFLSFHFESAWSQKPILKFSHSVVCRVSLSRVSAHLISSSVTFCVFYATSISNRRNPPPTVKKPICFRGMPRCCSGGRGR